MLRYGKRKYKKRPPSLRRHYPDQVQRVCSQHPCFAAGGTPGICVAVPSGPGDGAKVKSFKWL